METKHIIFKNFNYKNKQSNKKKLNNFIKFKNLVDKHNVNAIIGPFLDKNLIAGASSISSEEIPIFAPFTSLDNLSNVNKNIYLLN